MTMREEIHALRRRIEEIENRLTQNIFTTTGQRFPTGHTVGYMPADMSARRKRVLWWGRIIPRPEGAQRGGIYGDFVWVLRDDDAVRGVYPWNLVSGDPSL